MNASLGLASYPAASSGSSHQEYMHQFQQPIVASEDVLMGSTKNPEEVSTRDQYATVDSQSFPLGEAERHGISDG